jgi:hypothetical protein
LLGSFSLTLDRRLAGLRGGGWLGNCFGRQWGIRDGECFGGSFGVFRVCDAFDYKSRCFCKLRVFHGNGDLGQSHGRPLGGAVEDAVCHAFCPKGLVALFAQDPADGIDDVGLSAAIGADDAGRAVAAEGDYGALAERLEAKNLHFSELKQGFPFGRELPLRDALPHMLRRCRALNSPEFDRAKRDDFSFLEGRFFHATFLPVTDRNHTRLAGSQSEAQPPGAKMAVREKSVTRVRERVKARASYCGYFPHATIGANSAEATNSLAQFLGNESKTAIVHDPLAVAPKRGSRLLFDCCEEGIEVVVRVLALEVPAEHLQPVAEAVLAVF